MILGRLGPGQVGPGQLEADTQDSDLHTFVKKINLRSASILGNFRDGKGSSIYYVIIFGGLGRPLPPYVICNHLGLPPPM